MKKCQYAFSTIYYLPAVSGRGGWIPIWIIVTNIRFMPNSKHSLRCYTLESSLTYINQVRKVSEALQIIFHIFHVFAPEYTHYTWTAFFDYNAAHNIKLTTIMYQNYQIIKAVESLIWILIQGLSYWKPKSKSKTKRKVLRDKRLFT